MEGVSEFGDEEETFPGPRSPMGVKVLDARSQGHVMGNYSNNKIMTVRCSLLVNIAFVDLCDWVCLRVHRVVALPFKRPRPKYTAPFLSEDVGSEVPRSAHRAAVSGKIALELFLKNHVPFLTQTRLNCHPATSKIFS
jgi:hypothetical protein